MTTSAPARRRAADASAGGMPPAVAITRRRAPMRIVAGVLVVAVGCLVGAVAATRLDRSVQVLAVARTVPAGTVLTATDVRTVSIVVDPSLHVIDAAQLSTVVGQTAAVPLAAGTLLTREQVGASLDPGVGQALLAVGVKNGHCPAGLSAGVTVLVLVVPATTAGGSADVGVVRAQAVVRDVQVPDSGGLTVVTLQLSADAAVRVAAATGEVTLVVQGQ